MKILILSLFIFSTSVWSKNFEIEGVKFSLEVKSEWVDTIGLFDIPLTLSGPMINDVRPIISVTPTEMTKVKFAEQKDNQTNEDYQSERKRWLSTHKGSVINFYPYQKTKWDGVEEVHILGYSYSINENVYDEKTYYVLCKGRLYHLKTLVQEIHFESLKEIEGIIRSFQCQN